MAETGSPSIDIEASPERIMEVILDLPSYPDWQSAFKKAVVLEEDDEGRAKRAEFEVDARIKTVHYILEYTYGENRVGWEKVDGDVKDIKGSYTLEPQGSSTKVTYDYSIDPGFPVPGFLRKQGVRMMVTSALNDLKARAES